MLMGKFPSLSNLETLLQFMVSSTMFSSKKIPKSDRGQKDHPINLDKSIWTYPTILGGLFD